MADTQITMQQKTRAPAVYRVPEGVEFVLKAVYAEVNDDGAIGDWFPALAITSDAGLLVTIAADEGAIMTAGDDAEVSWFPGVKSGAPAATGGAPDYIIMYGILLAVTDPAIGDNDHAKFDAATFVTNDASLWTFDLDGSGRIKEVHATAPGRYESWAKFKWPGAGGAYQKSTTADIFGIGPVLMSSTWSTVSATQEEDTIGAFTDMASGTAQFDVTISQNTGGSINFVCPYWWIKHWAV